jgi:hypothetical protein
MYCFLLLGSFIVVLISRVFVKGVSCMSILDPSFSVAAEPGVTEEVPTDGQPAPSAESAGGESQSEAKKEQEAAAAPPEGEGEGEGEVDSSTITVEELAPATANIANALVCVATCHVARNFTRRKVSLMFSLVKFMSHKCFVDPLLIWSRSWTPPSRRTKGLRTGTV